MIKKKSLEDVKLPVFWQSECNTFLTIYIQIVKNVVCATCSYRLVSKFYRSIDAVE